MVCLRITFCFSRGILEHDRTTIDEQATAKYRKKIRHYAYITGRVVTLTLAPHEEYISISVCHDEPVSVCCFGCIAIPYDERPYVTYKISSLLLIRKLTGWQPILRFLRS